MTFKRLAESTLTDDALFADYEAAQKVYRVRMGREGVYYLKALTTCFIPYSALSRAFLRITGVTSRVCCGPASFEMFHVVFCSGDEETAKVEVDSSTKGERILAALSAAAPKVIIGKL